MDELRRQLIECFTLVFSKVKEDDLLGLNIINCEDWDSVANISLTTIIEESFDITLKTEDLDHLTSFQSILKYIATVKGYI